VTIGAMAVQAFEAANRPEIVRLEIGRAVVYHASVFLYPGTRDTVLAIAEWSLVQTAVPQRGYDGVPIGARDPDRIAIRGPLLSGACVPLGASWLRHLQLKAIDQFSFNE
jgi:hypothetical protein